MSIRAKFHIAAETGIAAKTTVMNIKTIQIIGSEEVYVFPPECQAVVNQPELAKNSIIANAVKSLKKRGQFRNLGITLDENLKNIYLDSEGNVCYRGQYLDEAPKQKFFSNVTIPEKKRSLQSLTKDMILDKFVGKNQNATMWLQTFVRECTRMDILETQYAEVLRLFLDGQATDWYSATFKLLGITETWEKWSESFLENFVQKGWYDIVFAYSYRYFSGSLSEYALKKLNLLIDADPSLTEKSRINFIVVGLPPFIRNRLNRTDIKDHGDLMTELSHLESIVNRPRNRNNIMSFKTREGNQQKRQEDGTGNYKNISERKTCTICERIGFPGRHHSETLCRNRNFEKNNSVNSKNVKVTNNTELEDIINEELIESKKN
jgi:hypothetical protein